MTLRGFRSVKSNDEMPEITFLRMQIQVFLHFNHCYFGTSKFYFFLLGCEGKIKISRGYYEDNGPNLYTGSWALFDDVDMPEEE